MNIAAFALKNRAVMMLAALILVTYGVVSYQTMPRRADPAFTIRACQVVTQWPGAPAEKVEQLVTDPIEQAVESIDEVDTITSTSRTGQSVISVELQESVGGDEIQQIFDEIRAKVANVQMPTRDVEPFVNSDFADTAVQLIAVYQTQEGAAARPYSPREMELIAETIKDQLKLVEGVASVELYGVQEEAIFIEAGAAEWSQVEVTVSQLADLLEARNIVAPGGSLDTGRTRYNIHPSGAFDAVEDIRRVTVAADERSGTPVLLSDLGLTVRRGYTDPARSIVRFGDPDEGPRDAIVIAYTMKAGTNSVALGQAITQRLDDIRDRDKLIPRDIGLHIVADEPTFVQEKVTGFSANVAQAILIVVIIAFLMVGLRIALVMAASIPIVLFSAIGLSRFFGVELEQMSIAALIIALGMLVDNAIEVCDNTHRLQREGVSRLRSVTEGVRQVAFPVLMATGTTVAAFLPMVFMLSGNSAEYIYSIPVVVSITLLVSWLNAMTLMAVLAYWFIRPSKDGKHRRAPLELFGALLMRIRHPKGVPADAPGFTDLYGRAAAICIRAKWLTLLVAAAMLVGSLMLPVGSQFFPQDNRDLFYIEVVLPEGASIAQTNAAMQTVEDTLLRLGDNGKMSPQRLAGYYAHAGGGAPRWYLSLSPEPPTSNYANILVRTTDARHTPTLVADLRAELAGKVPGARILVSQLSLGPPLDSPIAVRIYGNGPATDLAQLRQQAGRLAEVMRGTDGTDDVHDLWGNLGSELYVDVDPAAANLAGGLTEQHVAASLQAYASGQKLTEYREGDHTVPVYFRLREEDRDDPADLASMYVEGPGGKIPIGQVAEVYPRQTDIKIIREDRNRMIEVRSKVEPGLLANSILADMMPGIDALAADLPPGYRLEVRGEQYESSKASSSFIMSFLVSFAGIVMCLVIMYNGFVKPIVILLTLPLAAAGSLFGLWLMDTALGFMPMLGLVSLAGIVLNTGIIYIEFAEHRIRETKAHNKPDDRAKPGEKNVAGLTRAAFHRCLVEAGKMRLLPIMLTTLTTVGGLIPLALSGGPMWEGLAYVLIFGLLIATFLTLLVLPALYAVFAENFRMQVLPRGEHVIETRSATPAASS